VFGVKVGAHQGRFVIVQDALSREFREGLPMELLNADDLVTMAETEEQLVKNQKWKKEYGGEGIQE